MRQTKRRTTKFERVESVEVIKFSDRQRIKELCPDGFVYDLTIANDNNYFANDILVHNCGAFPKPSKRTKTLKALCINKPIIFLSGTPSPESYSQLYHQFYISSFSPFLNYTNFYKFAKDYVIVAQKFLYGNAINDYSGGIKDLILKKIDHLFIRKTQAEAGFDKPINETILKIKIDDNIYKLIDILRKKKLYKMKDDTNILADTPAKLMQKVHQLCSGTIITEEGNYKVLDTSKVEYIKRNFNNKKVAIYYKYKSEGEVLRSNFITTDSPEEFNSNDNIVFCSQILSGREGVNLSTADCIIFYNIDYSALSYWQARDRMQSKDRIKENKVYWLFSERGIEAKIYKAVLNKKNYTLTHFKNDREFYSKKDN